MKRLFTTLMTLSLFFSFFFVSCDNSGDVVDDPTQEEETTDPDPDPEEPDDSTDETPSVSNIAAEVTTTPYVYKTSELGTEIKIYHVATASSLEGEPKAAIVFFHGGGWSSGSWTTFQQHCNYLATQGMVCFSSQYRVTKDDTIDDLPEAVSIVECLEDAKSAIRWVKANAEQFNIDPTKIVAGGGSAGGCLAAGVSMCDLIYDENDDLDISLDLAGLVLFNPVIHNGNDEFPAYNYSGVDAACKAAGFADYSAFSPMANIDEDVPPTIFLVGENDTYIPPITAIEYQRRIESYGGVCELWIHENRSHSFYNFIPTSTSTSATGFTATMPYVHDFLRDLGLINDNSSLVLDWLSYGGYSNYTYVDNFLYDTTNLNIADEYTQWCSDNDYAEMPILGTNLVTNPDFEDGTYTGWTHENESYQTIISDPDLVVAGSYSLYSSGSWQKIYQTIPVVSGERYYFGFTGRHTSDTLSASGEGSANSGSYYLSIRTNALNGSSEMANTTSISSVTDTNTWSSIAFEANVSQIELVLVLQGGHGASDNFFFALSEEREEELGGSDVEGFDPFPEVEWDPTNEEPTYEGNLLVNGDFEDKSTSPWVADNSSATMSIVTNSIAINGYYSLLVTGSWPRIYQVVAVEAGKTYEYGFTGRQLLAEGESGGSYPTGGRVSVSIKTGSATGTVVSGSELSVTSGTDTERVSTVTIPSDTEEIYFMINSSGYYGYFDSIYFRASDE
ncbi:MAG: alpha/beta hydrolase fold domain-containing protein [Rikenellaceae bacterium]